MIVLDTNALILWLLGNERLSPALHRRLESEEVLYCSISLWEIDLKQRQGKLVLPWTARDCQEIKDGKISEGGSCRYRTLAGRQATGMEPQRPCRQTYYGIGPQYEL